MKILLTMSIALGILAPDQSRCRNRIAEHEKTSTFKASDTPLGRVQQWARVCSANLFDPERRSFVRALWSDPQSIPVKVATDKVANGRLPAGVGMYVRAHPPHATGQASLLYEDAKSGKPPLSLGASDVSSFGEKEVMSANGWIAAWRVQ